MARKSYEQRLENCKHPLLKKLFKIMIDKRSNLCVAANFETIEDTLRFVDRVGKHICILKTQIYRFEGDFKNNLKSLYEKKKEHNFLLFDDPKLCDGLETVYSIYKNIFVKYVDLVTVYAGLGDDIFRAIEKAALEANLPEDEPRGCLAVCEFSFEGVIPADPSLLLEVAERNSSICVGVIAQTLQVKDDCAMIKATPGVHLTSTSDGFGQQWKHPRVAVTNGSDVVIVGRGIVSAPANDLEKVTIEYKEASYKAYTDSLNM